jgi:hypothetical protein
MIWRAYGHPTGTDALLACRAPRRRRVLAIGTKGTCIIPTKRKSSCRARHRSLTRSFEKSTITGILGWITSDLIKLHQAVLEK